ncbi:hypothetical protein QBC35DRAFT_495478 [Podospora australis]|uniref:ATP-dependent RNA helicase DHX8 n=1 Tax=Podospora australis TaxID=1536484 RepID=A0AAN6WUR1_9PEZI|nr:hypothetical protein QBC35DRAFT_495478 [Podospora australis]
MSSPTPASLPPVSRAKPVATRQIRAHYDEETITVYQAYSKTIATAAVEHQKLNASPDYKTATRMTWIKPSWAWMLYRSGYSYKDSRQARILAIKMRHGDFVKLLEMGVLSSNHATSHTSDGKGQGERGAEGDEKEGRKEKLGGVRIQWDPERTVRLEKIEGVRSIQIGIPGDMVERWIGEMIVSIEDVTDKARMLKRVLDEDEGVTDAELIERGLVPEERVFEVPVGGVARERLRMD